MSLQSLITNAIEGGKVPEKESNVSIINEQELLSSLPEDALIISIDNSYNVQTSTSGNYIQ